MSVIGLSLVSCLFAFSEVQAQNTPEVTTDKRFARGATMAFGRIKTAKAVGGVAISKRGFCLSQNPEPTVDDILSTKTITNSGAIYYFENLEPATIYYMRAYATNRDGETGYGEVIKFATVPKGNVTFWYNDGGDAAANTRIKDAATNACNIFNDLTSIRKKFNIGYSAGTPTADCYYDDEPWMNMGANASYQRTGTIMHEMQHGMGVIPYSTQWSGNILRSGDGTGLWLGDRVTDFLNFWDNKTDSHLNGDTQHMWPYGINGAQEDDGSLKTYYANAMIGQALGEDGLEHRSDVFAEPYYSFVQDDNTKYYLKNESEERGLYDSYLIPNTTGILKWRKMTAAAAAENDSAAWYITFTPANQYYQLRNAATGQYLTFGASIKTADHATPTANDNFHLMRGRVDVMGSRETALRGYWIIHPTGNWEPKAIQANVNGNIGATTFDIRNSASAQRWLILTAEEAMTAEQGSMAKLTEGIAKKVEQLKTLFAVPHMETIAGTDLQLLAVISQAEALTDVTPDAVTALNDQLDAATLDFLSGVAATDKEQPFDLSYCIQNPDMDTADGWSETPAISYSCGEFYEKTFDMNQTLRNLPKGTFRLAVQGFQRAGKAADAYSYYSSGTDKITCYLYAGNKSEKIADICSEAQRSKLGGNESTVGGNLYIPNNMQAASIYFKKGYYENTVDNQVATKGGALKVGLRSNSMGSYYWVIFDNFRLYFFGDEEALTDGISTMHDAQSTMHNDAVYTLSGQRLAAPKKGINIVGGRKIVIK